LFGRTDTKQQHPEFIQNQGDAMTTVTVTETIAGPAATVWALLSDFGGVQVGGPITSVEVQGEGVGMVRTLGLGGGVVVERLDAYQPEAMTFGYSILNDDSPLPVKGYVASVRIADLGDGTCRVDWSGTFEPRGVPEADAVNVVEGIYKGGIAGVRKAVAG
jgi:hypothetical protein